MMHGGEAEKSTLFDKSGYDEDEGDDTDRDDSRYHGNPKQTMTGTAVFDKM